MVAGVYACVCVCACEGERKKEERRRPREGLSNGVAVVVGEFQAGLATLDLTLPPLLSDYFGCCFSR